MIQKLRIIELENRIKRSIKARPQMLNENTKVNSPLKVTYVLNRTSVCGGVKIILEQANYLIEQGWDVSLVSHFPCPDWFPVKAKYIKVPFHIDVAQGIPDCDVIVATYYDHIQACIETGIAPVVYFEQGDEHLFHLDRLQYELQLFVEKQLKLPQFVCTVSHQAALLMKQNFGLDSEVIPNAIDHQVFHLNEGISNPVEEPYILMMGSENNAFKGIKRIIKAVNTVKLQLEEVKLYWINPDFPSEPWASMVDRVFVNPPQHKIAELYRGALLFVSASEYETFSLPVLEAMATGCPVVSTQNYGVMEYGVDYENVLFTEIGNDIDLINKIKLALNDIELRKNLSINGLTTAKKYTWNSSIDKLANFLIRAAQFEVVPYVELSDWDLRVQADDFNQPEDWERFLNQLKVIPDDIVYLPVIYDWIDRHPIARWEIAAERKKQDSKSSMRINIPIRGKNTDLQKITLGLGIQEVREEKFDAALNYFVSQYSNLDEEWKPVCTKWIVLCLIELNRDQDAINVLEDALKVYDTFSDLYYLFYLVLKMNQYLDEANKKSDMLKVIGDGMHEVEWFYNVAELV